jgi:guanosine-3',5'-bis(diphosphate) 3'-pyrophosphohydrolase
MKDANLLIEAAWFAAEKHKNQRRKNAAASPYINHPIKVARILVQAGVEDPEILAAALLHDTVEDTETSLEELEEKFSPRIRQLVSELSDDKSLGKTERKQLQISRAASVSEGAALIKLGDKIANVEDIASDPPEGWSLQRRREYLDWAEAVVHRLPKVNRLLEERCAELIKRGREELRALEA